LSEIFFIYDNEKNKKSESRLSIALWGIEPFLLVTRGFSHVTLSKTITVIHKGFLCDFGLRRYWSVWILDRKTQGNFVLGVMRVEGFPPGFLSVHRLLALAIGSKFYKKITKKIVLFYPSGGTRTHIS
jgi:hypothetical protein